MKTTLCVLAVLCAWPAAQALAAAAGSDQTPATNASAPPATQEASASAPQKPSKLILVDNEVNDQELKQILAKGYRPEPHGDRVLYCRSEAEIGTRFKTKTCKSSARILADEILGKAIANDAQRDAGNKNYDKQVKTGR